MSLIVGPAYVSQEQRWKRYKCSVFGFAEHGRVERARCDDAKMGYKEIKKEKKKEKKNDHIVYN